MGRFLTEHPTPSTIRSRRSRAKGRSKPQPPATPAPSGATVAGDTASPAAMASGRAGGAATLPPKLGTIAFEAESFTLQCKVELDRAIAAGESMSTRASLAVTYQRALAALAELRGESDPGLSPSQVARSAPFRRLLGKITSTLARHPAALREVLEVLEREEEVTS